MKQRDRLSGMCEECQPLSAALTVHCGIQIACFYEPDTRLEGLVIAGRETAAGDLWDEDESNVTATHTHTHTPTRVCHRNLPLC
jgi:hypothetical protein